MKSENETPQAIAFMKKLASNFCSDKKCFIVVSHIVSNTIDLLNVLSQEGRIAGVIAKPNSIDPVSEEKLKRAEINFVDVKRQDFLLSSTISKKIKPLIKEDEKLILIDMGGYFATSLKQLNNLPNLAGIIEDTENGMQKYEKALENLPNNKIPIFSIARSRSKDFEDYLIGRSIADATINILKENNKVLTRKKIGIIGFGEVGRGAAFYLRDNLGFDVKIFDKDPKVQDLVKKSGFRARDKQDLLENSDVLICATGNKSLTDIDLQYIKEGCYISSCTSNDDEFDFKELNLTKLEKIGTKIKTFSGINFINDGNAVNFAYPKKCTQMISPYIYLTFSALIQSAIKLDKKEISSLQKINCLLPDEEKTLISEFLQSIKSNNDNQQFINKIRKTDLWKGL